MASTPSVRGIVAITPDTKRADVGRPARTAPQRERLGTALSVAAAALFGLGASVSKVTLHSGVDPIRLTALRCTGTAICLLVVILCTKPSLLRVRVADLAVLAVLGMTGAALVQFLFFVAIDRLPVGIALLLEFTAPFIIAVYSHVVLGQPAGRRSWLAIGLGIAGLAVVAKVWTDTGLDLLGALAGLAAAGCLAAFLMIGKQALRRHHPLTMSFWMFAVSSLFWAVAAPWWNFHFAALSTRASLLGVLDGIRVPIWVAVLWVVVLGTLVPYLLEIASLERLTPTAKGVVGMSEPLIAAAVAWAWIGEALDSSQLLGACLTLIGIAVIRTGHANSSRLDGPRHATVPPLEGQTLSRTPGGS